MAQVILGKIWGAIRGLGEVFSTIFGLFIVGRLVWYLIKVIMNCGYIHSAHGCSPKLAWSFCTEVLFTHHYRKVQRRQRPTTATGRSDNDPSERPRKRRRTIKDSLKSMFSGNCADGPRSSDSEEELPNPPAGQLSSQEMADIMDRSVRRQEDRLASTRRVQANIEALNREVDSMHRLDRPPPPYVTPPASQADVIVHPNAPRVSPMRNADPGSERVNYLPDPTGRTFGRMQYSRVLNTDRFAFTPVPTNPSAVTESQSLPDPPAATDDNP